MSYLIHGLVRVAGLLAALVLWAVAAMRGFAEQASAMTLADLERALVQAVPGWLEAGLAAPWWVFGLVAALPSLFLVWPSGRAALDDDPESVTAADGDTPLWRAPAMHPPIPVALVDPAPGFARYEPQAPAVVPDAMISAFRAVAGRSAAEDACANMNADRAWSRVRDILVARPDADRDGTWSVGEVTPDGPAVSRWGANEEPQWTRSLGGDPPHAYGAGYQGDVILEAEDGVEHHCRLAIVPARNCSAEMAEAIGRAIEAFVAARGRMDRFEPDRHG